MLDEMEPILPASESEPGSPLDIPEEALQTTITQIATRLRHTGHAESAHFMDVAALILRDQARY